MRVIKLFLITLISLLVISCQSKFSNIGKTDLSTQELYSLGNKDIKHKNHTRAISTFENILFQYPGNIISADIEIMHAYSLYLDGQYNKTNHVLNNFIKLHPGHKHIQYVYYLKALSLYAQISPIGLDQLMTKHAKKDLQEIVIRYPESKYALDAVSKINLINNLLAGHEMSVGRYYLKRKNIAAAIKRFQVVIEKYNGTIYSPEALYRLIECNCMLGLSNESQNYLSVLVDQYPKSKWLAFTKNIL